VFLIGSWYTKDELGKRSNIFQAATAAGTLLSGVLQGGVQTTLHGKSGMPGWRWIFTIDAVISLPIAIAAFFFIPDLPSVIKPNWIFKQEDIDLANKRLASVGRVGPKKGGLGLTALWKIITTWEIFAFTFVYSCYIFAQSKSSTASGRLISDPQQSMSFWLKYSQDPKYTIQQINYYPCGIWATQIVSALGFAWISDTVLKGRRWPPLVFVGVCPPRLQVDTANLSFGIV
jgi:ACS family pantothenate transporter-like MFS transporter